MSTVSGKITGLPAGVKKHMKERHKIISRKERLRKIKLPGLKRRLLQALDRQSELDRPVLPLIKVPRLLKDLNFGRVFDMHRLRVSMLLNNCKPDHPDNHDIMMRVLYEKTGKIPIEEEVQAALEEEYQKG